MARRDNGRRNGMRAAARGAVVAGAVASSGLLAGCAWWKGQTPGGRSASLDQFSYVSTAFAPMTVTLRDVRDGSEIWSLDVPVNRKLIVRFDPADDEERDTLRPAIMCWDVVDVDDSSSLENEVPVPQDPYRRLEVTLRETPEYSDPAVPHFADRLEDEPRVVSTSASEAPPSRVVPILASPMMICARRWPRPSVARRMIHCARRGRRKRCGLRRRRDSMRS